MNPIQFLGRSRFLNQTERNRFRKTLHQLCLNKNKRIENLSYVFCNDEEMLKINKEHLHHDTYTDIITFDLGDKQNSIDGEIYISVDRTKENAAAFHVKPEEELARVVFHGLLHLLGHKDKNPEDQAKMRAAEEEALKLWREQA